MTCNNRSPVSLTLWTKVYKRVWRVQMRWLLERNCSRLKLDRIAGEAELAEGSISRRWPSSKALPATKSDVHVHYAHGSIRTSRSTAMSPRVVQLSRSQVALHVGRSLCFFIFFSHLDLLLKSTQGINWKNAGSWGRSRLFNR